MTHFHQGWESTFAWIAKKASSMFLILRCRYITKFLHAQKRFRRVKNNKFDMKNTPTRVISCVHKNCLICLITNRDQVCKLL